jgi:outer membrane receptor protein involved in Fe transport
MMYLAGVLLSFLLFASANDLTLSVNVTNSAGQAISGVSVILENTTEVKRWEGTTSESGTFHFERLPIGSYVLHIAKEGFYADETELHLEASKVVDFTIVPVDNRHDEVDVVARPEPINTETVSTERTVDSEVIQTLPYTGRRNFLNALTLMPGVLSDNSGGMHIQGSRSDQIRYQLDGLNVTDPSGGLGSNIPIDAIESVELDLSGYSAEFGKGSGGVIRVESKFIGDKMKWGLTDFLPGINFKQRTISDIGPRFLLSGPIIPGKAWFMYSNTLRYIRTFNESLAEGMNRQNQGIADQLGKLQRNFGESHVVTLSVLSNIENSGNAGLSTLRPLAATTNLMSRSTTAAISNRNIFHGALFETTVQYSNRHDSNLAKGTATLIVTPDGWSGNYYADSWDRSSRLHLGQNVSLERTLRGLVHHIKFGAEADDVTSHLMVNERPFQIRDAANNLQQIVAFDGPNSAVIHNYQAGMFAQDRVSITGRIQLELGVRDDRESVAGGMNVAPRLAASFLPLGNNHSKISAGFGYFYDNIALQNIELARMQRRLTTSIDAYGNSAPVTAPTALQVSPNLRDPYDVHWNAAWEHEWAPRWVSRINIVHKRGEYQTRQGTIPSPDGFNLQFNNSGSSRYRAVELSIDRPIRSNLHILGSYVYSQSKSRPSLSIDFPDPAIDQIPLAADRWNAPHRFLSWGYFPFFVKSEASYAFEARSGFPFSPIDQFGHLAGTFDGYKMPTVFLTNLSLEKELPIVFGKRMALQLGVTNLLNRFNPRYVDANVNSPTFLRYSDSSGRNLYARVRLLKK